MAKSTKGRKARPGNPLPEKPQEQQKRPDQRQPDFNPGHMGGQNIGRSPAGSDSRARTAAEIETLVEKLSAFQNDELAQIPILPEGSQLKQGAVYLDLRDPTPVPITANADMTAGPAHYYTPKSEVPYEIWNRLVEALAPARLRPDAPMEAAENKPFTPQRAAIESEVGHPAPSTDPHADTKMDETIAESFPASDPPGWNTGRDK